MEGVNHVRPILIIFYLSIELFPWLAKGDDLYIIHFYTWIYHVKMHPEKKQYSIFNELMRN